MMQNIHTQTDYETALARVSELMDATPGSPEEEELARLAELIEAYEDIHYPIDPPDPEAARRFRAEQEANPIPSHQATAH